MAMTKQEATRIVSCGACNGRGAIDHVTHLEECHISKCVDEAHLQWQQTPCADCQGAGHVVLRDVWQVRCPAEFSMGSGTVLYSAQPVGHLGDHIHTWPQSDDLLARLRVWLIAKRNAWSASIESHEHVVRVRTLDEVIAHVDALARDGE